MCQACRPSGVSASHVIPTSHGHVPQQYDVYSSCALVRRTFLWCLCVAACSALYGTAWRHVCTDSTTGFVGLGRCAKDCTCCIVYICSRQRVSLHSAFVDASCTLNLLLVFFYLLLLCCRDVQSQLHSAARGFRNGLSRTNCRMSNG